MGEKIQIFIKDTNWITGKPKVNKIYLARIRHLGQLKKAKVVKVGKMTEIKFLEPVLVAPGQSLVLYNKEECIGGGVVV